jgi:hypothetical protein
MSDFLTESEMPYRDAERIFADRGVDVSGMNSVELRKAWMALMKKHHSDAGGAGGDAGIINAAYDALKVNTNPTSSRTADTTGKDPKKWMIYGFNGHWFNDGAKFTGDRSHFGQIIQPALNSFTKDHVVAIFAQCEANPTMLYLIYINCLGFKGYLGPIYATSFPYVEYPYGDFSSPIGQKIKDAARSLVVAKMNELDKRTPEQKQSRYA